jgi:hypothetical protein
MPGTEILTRILNRYDAAFGRTRLLARYPSPENKNLDSAWSCCGRKASRIGGSRRPRR